MKKCDAVPAGPGGGSTPVYEEDSDELQLLLELEPTGGGGSTAPVAPKPLIAAGGGTVMPFGLSAFASALGSGPSLLAEPLPGPACPCA